MGVASVAAGARVEVRDADDGRLVAVGEASHPVGSAGRGEQAVEVWWDGVVEAVAAAGLRAEVAALAVAAQRQALVLVDGAGAAILPASLRHDARAATTARELVARLGADRLARATGHVTSAQTPLARLVWRMATDPSAAAATAAVLGAADVLTARLTGRRVTDRGGASATGWWDPVGGRWRVDLLDRAARPAPPGGWAAVLPEVLRPADPADRVNATVNDLLGIRGRPLVAAGTGDLMARSLAAGVGAGTAAALLDDDDAVVVAGTSTPVADPSGAVAGFADAAGGHLPTVALSPVGPALATIARITGTDAAGLAARASAVAGTGPADAGRLLVVAAGTGPGLVVGLDHDTGPAELARAALLGAAAEVVAALAVLERVGGGDPEGGRVLLAGSTARWPGLADAVADLAGREIHVTKGLGAAAGACAQAAAALHDRDPLDVVRAWGLDAADAIGPAHEVDTDAVLAAHLAVREGMKGHGPAT
jgi:xylulokinase